MVAAAVRLLETTLIRVGNEEYARDNKSFGLTTLRDRHAKVRGSQLKLTFRGKGGKEHIVELRDKRLARIVKACQELPGQRLFKYVDDDGRRRSTIDSDDVNDYLRDHMGDEFSAKDFRTWAGTVLAARAFAALGDEAATPASVKRAVEQVAQQLGNTPDRLSNVLHPPGDRQLIPRRFAGRADGRAGRRKAGEGPRVARRGALRLVGAALAAQEGEPACRAARPLNHRTVAASACRIEYVTPRCQPCVPCW